MSLPNRGQPGDAAPPGGASPANAADCLAGGGEMGALMRSIDWSQTALGPVEGWPQSLRTTVSTCLSSRFPIFVWWGPELVMLYNDGYRPMLGATKHPAAMGRPGREVWPEIWHVIGPMLEGVVTRGEATWSEDQFLLADRNGFLEECYFTFSYSPIRDESGGIGGVFCAVTEETPKVLGQRRLAMLAALAARSADGRTFDAACSIALATIAENAADVPFSMLYRIEGGRARLVGATALPAGHPALVPELELDDRTGAFDLRSACAGEVVVDDLDRVLPGIEWPAGARRAILLPLARSGQAVPYGVFVAGVSPRLALDARYRELYRLVAAQIATAIRNARAYEDEAAQVRALAEIDRAKTAFFSNVSHELRTPLTLVLGPLEEALARRDAAVRDVAPALEVAQRNARRLHKLVNELLEFSRIEAGRLDASFVATDLRALTADLASELRSLIESAGIRYEVAVEPLPAPVFVDRQMWEKIVLNLASNAFKFTHEGTIRVALRADGDVVELEVADTGVGIPEAELPRIFDRFHRVEGARARTLEGTGIGLALVSELVRMHGGTIVARSVAGEGTRMIVRIPTGSAHLPPQMVRDEAHHGHAGRDDVAQRARRAASAYVGEAASWTGAAVAAPAGGARGRGRELVLVADDNADMREHVARILGDRWDVLVACDGSQALALAREHRPDLVLTDVMMPGLDGFELLDAIRDEPSIAQIPVVMLSARAGDEAKVDGFAAGANDYVVKPFSARELVARIAAQLELAAARRDAEREREHLRSVLAQAPVAIAVSHGPQHVFELANERFVEVFGRADVVGKTVREAFPDAESESIWRVLDRVYETGVPFSTPEHEVVVRTDDGDGRARRIVASSITPVRDEDGRTTRLVAVATDVTEQVSARERMDALRADAEKANRTKDEFLAMLGHELRNPMAPIVTAVHLMRLRGDERTARERATIERQVEHLVRLLDDLYDVSRVTQGKIQLRRARVEMAAVIASALEIASPLLEQRRHSLAIQVPRTGLAVDGDAARLTQIVSNLVTNAAKYTDPGGRIEIDADREGSDVWIRVRDDGRGISSEMLPRVFEAFAQERQPIDRAEGGLGLGLAIVRGLVALHGGEVQAYSEGLGKGTEMVVRLPAAEPEEAADAQRSEPPRRSDRPSRGTLDVLVVDDNGDAADMLAEFLRGLGHHARTANDAPRALELAREHAPDVALLDIGLPIVDGYELARALRELPGFAAVPLVAVTGYGQDRDLERSRRAGFDAHLVKPVRFETLESVLDSVAHPSPRPRS